MSGVAKCVMSNSGGAQHKVPLILLCRNNFSRMPNKFEFGATFSIVVFALNWFWFVFSFSFICIPIGGAESPYGKQHHLLINSQNNFKVEPSD